MRHAEFVDCIQFPFFSLSAFTFYWFFSIERIVRDIILGAGLGDSEFMYFILFPRRWTVSNWAGVEFSRCAWDSVSL